MTGHIFKNLYICKSSIIFIAILGIVCSAVCITISAMGSSMTDIDSSDLMPIFALCHFFVFFSGTFSLTTLFTCDEHSAWINFVSSTPFSAKGHVLAKYCTMLLINILMIFICLISNAISFSIYPDANIIKAIAIFFLIAILYDSITMPFFFRFGGNKGLAAVGITAAVILFIAVVYFLYGDISVIDLKDPLSSIIKFFSKKWSWVTSLVIFCITAVLYFVSYIISLKLYKKGTENYE